jgi:hypothetical protein
MISYGILFQSLTYRFFLVSSAGILIHLGCRYYVCNYGSAGNVIGRSMYRSGRSCSECPAYSTCSTQYPGICTYKTGSSNSPPVPR